MGEEIKIIAFAIQEFEDSGRGSKTAMARFILGKLFEHGYEINKPCSHEWEYFHDIIEVEIEQCKKCFDLRYKE
jgi:hypothetical protein